jgi:DNA-directed RNA polymerase subunit RPC12/RpoP
MEDVVKFCPSCGTQAGGAAPARPEKEKVGNIRKCPACGAEVPAMTAVCAECGHEFSNVSVGGDIKQFFEKIVELEKAANEGGWGSEKSGEEAALNAYVQGYPVPSTKEDILEFLMFCLSRAKVGISIVFGKPEFFWDINDTQYGKKAVQVYDKARISLASDPAFVEKIAAMLREKGIPLTKEEEEAILKQHKSKQTAKSIKKMVIAAAVILAVVGFFSIGKLRNLSIKLPDYAEIPAENIIVSGSIENYLAPAGTGLTMKPTQDNETLELAFEFTALKNLQTVVDAAVEKKKKEEGFDKLEKGKKVTVDLHSAVMKIDEINIAALTEIRDKGALHKQLTKINKQMNPDAPTEELSDFVKALCKIEKGATKTVKLTIKADKKLMLALMEKTSIELVLTLGYNLYLFNTGVAAAGQEIGGVIIE